MVDQYITLEGKFTVVLYGHSTFNQKTKEVTKSFITNDNGRYNAKSPYEMFKELEIPNDLGLVKDKIKEYYEGE